jgi:hypothetical protein
MKFGLENGGKNTGIEYRVNLFIISEMCKRIAKNTKVNEFFSCRGSGIHMSYTRLRNILNGMPFEFTSELAMEIEELFGLDKRYFRLDDKDCINIKGIEKGDWEKYFKNGSGHAGNPIENKIMDKLNYISKEWEKMDKLDIDSGLRNICFYFKYGKKNENDTLRIKNMLELLDLTRWNNMDTEDLKKVSAQMDKHSEYIKAYLLCKEINEK